MANGSTKTSPGAQPEKARGAECGDRAGLVRKVRNDDERGDRSIERGKRF
jgi:hypothetical protein